MNSAGKSVWELLCDNSPNALVVFDRQFRIQMVNPTFCEMFRSDRDTILGQPITQFISDVDDIEPLWHSTEPLRREKHYETFDLYVTKIMFAIPEQDLMACIMVDISQEWKQKQELQRVKEETLRNVDLVVDKQMKVAQEIAGLLGETTAQTKVNLLRLAQMLKKGEL